MKTKKRKRRKTNEIYFVWFFFSNSFVLNWIENSDDKEKKMEKEKYTKKKERENSILTVASDTYFALAFI